MDRHMDTRTRGLLRTPSGKTGVQNKNWVGVTPIEEIVHSNPVIFYNILLFVVSLNLKKFLPILYDFHTHSKTLDKKTKVSNGVWLLTNSIIKTFIEIWILWSLNRY